MDNNRAQMTYAEGFAWGLIALLVPTILHLLLKSMAKGKPLPLPPGPRGWPIIGNMDLMGGKFIHKDLALLSARFGPLLYLTLGSRPALVVSSLVGAKEILKTQDNVFGNRADIHLFRSIFFGSIAFTQTGEYWRQMRKAAILELLCPHKIKSWQDGRMEEIADAMREISSPKIMGAEVNLNELGERIISRLIGCLLFSKGLSKETERLKSLIVEINAGGAQPLIGDFIPFLGFLDIAKKKVMARFISRWHALNREIIKLRQEKCGISATSKNLPECFLDILLRLRAQGQLVDGSDAAIGGVMLDLYGAGLETSPATLEWAMAELLANPEKLAKVREEIERGVRRNAIMVEDKDIGSMPYLRAVVKETLRLHPPVPLLLPRQSLARCIVGGGNYEVPNKTLVYVNIWAIGRDPNVWEEPLQFKPERFYSTTGNHNEGDAEQSFLSFGAGKRNCPGMALGLTSVQLILANLLHGFDWKLSPAPNSGSTIDMGEKYGVVVLKKGIPLVLIPKPRYNF